MKTEKIAAREDLADLNEDPITKEPGAHPVATGVGAAGAGTIGVAIGTAVAGPIGALVGAAVGAVVGGLGGSAVGEAIDPTDRAGGTGRNVDYPNEDTGLIAPTDMAAGSSIESGLTPFSSLTTPLAEGVLPGEFVTHESGRSEDLVPATLDRDEVAERAWGIYEAEGFPEGRALDHWVQAERELSDR